MGLEKDPARNTVRNTDIPVLVLTGPTASGKTETALLLAEQLGGEIVCADSMQIYRGMDIGTAKATVDEQRRVPHHLLDIRRPGDHFSVAEYKAAATAAIRDILNRHKQPVICGGTGQYLNALIEGLAFTEIPSNPELRAQLEKQAREEGLDSLYCQLQNNDPETAARVSPNDRKRIIRALELWRQTGLTMGEINRQSRLAGPDFRFCSFCLSHDRPVLYARIDRRVLQMIDAGLADEVRKLLELDLPAGSTCLQAIGYKEMLPYLRGESSLDETTALIQLATRHYAKRQLTWFRKMPSLNWLVNHNAQENVRIILENL